MSLFVERLWFPEERESWARRLSLSPLALAEAGFHLGVAARNALFDGGALEVHRVPDLSVVSVGNLTVGGTGKTPAVIHLARMLSEAGRKVCVLSRGYGRSSKAPLSFDSESLPRVEDAGDEPLLIASRCPGVRVFVGPDRVALAHEARDSGAEVALLDDGLQHRRLARDLDLVVIDAASGFGNGHLIPRGPLREPLSSLARASLLWIREAEEGVATIPLELRDLPVPRVRARYLPGCVITPEGTSLPIEALQGQPVVALAAIARPERFVRTLERRGARVVGAHLGRDHQRFALSDLQSAEQAAARAGAWLVTTEKDRVRLPPDFPAHVVRLEVTVLEGEQELQKLLQLS